MNALNYSVPLYQNEDYTPKTTPKIVEFTKAATATLPKEIVIQQLNDYSSIVDRSEMKLVGIKVSVTPDSPYDAIQTVEQYIKDGTCHLLEEIVSGTSVGQYIAAVSEVKTGIDFTYIIGVEVDSFDNLPLDLPPNTCTLTCPASRYAKIDRSNPIENTPTSNAKQSICYLTSSDFRENTGYCFDGTAMSFRIFNQEGTMTSAYEPVKAMTNPMDKFEQVGWEVVMLPAIRVIGCVGDGISAMLNLFDIENKIDWTAAGCLNPHCYYSFRVKINDKDETIFGYHVCDFSHVPEGCTTAEMASGLWVRFYQKQINNDDTSLLFEGVKEQFFQEHPEFVEDYSCRQCLYRAQYEQGATYSFPIRRIN